MGVFRGAGTVLSRGDAASPEVFTGVGDVVSIAGPAITKDEIEVTALDPDIVILGAAALLLTHELGLV